MFLSDLSQRNSTLRKPLQTFFLSMDGNHKY